MPISSKAEFDRLLDEDGEDCPRRMAGDIFQDTEAAARARSYFTGYAPSSPQIGLLKDGKVVFMLERYQIEGRTADQIATDLVGAFDQHCSA